MFCRSSDFRPAYAHLGELRAFAPPGAPMLAATATVTDVMRNVIEPPWNIFFESLTAEQN